MITTDISPLLPPITTRNSNEKRTYMRLPHAMIICLLLACIGTSWFAYQCLLVPQNTSFTPDWHGAKWIQAADGISSVAYFRYVTSINTRPDGAFVTISAEQVFHFSVNGFAVNNNFHDFEQGYFPRTYMYNIATLIKPGVNVFSAIISNFNKQRPMLRMSIGLVQGRSIHYAGTGTENTQWKATIRSDIIYPHYSTQAFFWNVWTTDKFDASSWLSAQDVVSPPANSSLNVDPLVYEQPIADHWMSVGLTQEAYFVQHFSLPLGITNVWLRIVAVGNANVFINGHSSILWNGQPILLSQDKTRYLTEGTQPTQYRSGLNQGVYNITPFLQMGENTVAVHVSAPFPAGANTQTGLGALNAALALDIVARDWQGHHYLITNDSGWHASAKLADGWTQNVQATSTWSGPIFVGRPGAAGTIYVPTSNTVRDIQISPVARIFLIIAYSILAVLGLWLSLSFLVMRRFYNSYIHALEVTSLAYLPALACEALLVVLAHEPNIWQPFPYTGTWALILIALVAAGYLLLYLNATILQKKRFANLIPGISSQPVGLLKRLLSNTQETAPVPIKQGLSVFLTRFLLWLRIHWGLVLIIVIATPLICYNLGYEPYWQDELTSYYAAKGILAHGIPVMPSGFIYPKGELYSYLLALVMAIFGDGGSTPRVLSVVEYLVGLPLLYTVGTYFFGRRIALLATATLAFSPMALLWGRQVRMYEQAQLFTLLSAYLIYRALLERHRVYLIYLAVFSLVLMYLSHEETFIVFPAIALWVLFASKDEKHRSFAVVYQKHWWFASIIGACIIGVQLLIVHFTHPPILGTDQSQIPFIQFTTNNIPYYIKLLFAPWALGRVVDLPWLTLNSALATIGCIMALRGKDLNAKYCAWFLFASFLTLMLVFTLSSDRYLYPILPFYYLMGAYALLRLLNALWLFARANITDLSTDKIHQVTVTSNDLYKPVRGVIWLITALVLTCVVLLPVLPANDYNPFVSHELGLSYHRHYPDYDGVGQYMKQNWKKGDIVIAIFPAISILYYVGHNDYFFSVDRALYLFEENGQITDTPTGSYPILNQTDFLTVLASHARVWVISDNGSYQSQVQGRFVFPPGFHLVYQGYQSAIYLRG